MAEKLKLTIMTPERVILNEKDVDSVVVPAWEGEMCVLPGHVSYVAELKEGILKYRENESEEYMSVFWGYMMIKDNRVTVLAEDASLAKELDEEKLRQEYQKEKEKLHYRDKEFNLEEAEMRLKRMLVNLKLMEIKRKRK